MKKFSTNTLSAQNSTSKNLVGNIVFLLKTIVCETPSRNQSMGSWQVHEAWEGKQWEGFGMIR